MVWYTIGMKKETVRSGVGIAIASLGILATAAFAADQFNFFFSHTYTSIDRGGFFSDFGAILTGSMAPSTDELLAD